MYYLSQFYPLVLGILLFLILKSLKLLKHKTRLSLESVSNYSDPYQDIFANIKTCNYSDVFHEIDENRIQFLYPYSKGKMALFDGYFTDSEFPRNAAYAQLIKDNLIINGEYRKASVNENSLYEIGFHRFGIIDLNNIGKIKYKKPNSQNIKVFAPEKEKLFSIVMKPGKFSGLLLSGIADYNISIV